MKQPTEDQVRQARVNRQKDVEDQVRDLMGCCVEYLGMPAPSQLERLLAQARRLEYRAYKKPLEDYVDG